MELIKLIFFFLVSLVMLGVIYVLLGVVKLMLNFIVMEFGMVVVLFFNFLMGYNDNLVKLN